MSTRRAVLDTNILISALLKSKNCEAILEALKQGAFSLVTSEDLLAEFDIVSDDPKFGFDEEDKRNIQGTVRDAAELVEPQEEITICRDPSDNLVLECAAAGKPDGIVSGDKDLLVLKEFRGIPIIKPKAFLDWLKS